MRRILTLITTAPAFFVLLAGITGCFSTQTGISDAEIETFERTGDATIDGWSRIEVHSEPEVEPAPVSRTSKAGACLVRSPAIEPPQTGLPAGPLASEGFIWKDALCDDAVSQLLIKDLRRRLRDLGYSIEATTPEPDASTTVAFEQFKRAEGIYGEGYVFEALKELDLDPATYVIEAALRLLSGADER